MGMSGMLEDLGGAERPQFRKFREFEDMADKVKDKEQKVLMYCTGGLRCSAAF
jgi:predicted sulfurtransferase